MYSVISVTVLMLPEAGRNKNVESKCKERVRLVNTWADHSTVEVADFMQKRAEALL